MQGRGMMQGQGMMQGPGMMGQGMPMQQSSNDPATRAFQDANRRNMQTMMAMPMTGNADRDFATAMMHHHQGAIDMAQVELQYGKDAELKQMAQKIIADQQKEIDQLRTWLNRQGAASGSSQ